MANVELTQEEAGFVYAMLDQVSVKGLPQKRIIVSVMGKLEWAVMPPAPEFPPQEKDVVEQDEEKAKKK